MERIRHRRPPLYIRPSQRENFFFLEKNFSWGVGLSMKIRDQGFFFSKATQPRWPQHTQRQDSLARSDSEKNLTMEH